MHCSSPPTQTCFAQLNLDDDTLSSDQRISILLDIVTIHCGERNSVILNLHKTVADLALGRRDATDGSAAGTEKSTQRIQTHRGHVQRCEAL